MGNRIVIYKSRNKAFVIIIVSILLVTAGWLFLQIPDKNIVGWSFIILSVLCLIFGIGTYFDRKPYIILTGKGITEMSTIRDEIEWDAILRVDEFYYRGLYFIRMLVERDYKPASVRPTWFHRFDKLYEKDGIKAIFMRIGFYEINSIKLAGFMQKMIKADPERRIELLNNFRSYY
ncbi:STM3941 family protein [uncultured Parabacteroides sp.]|uniref:STM3941 family protein n=1 Tax=uncultured Parabacteroides sp. TaxID=512312 RepID=UPI0025E21BBE|nr:STM3941 family protein [uncultured Parabacteroides sp.]